MFRCIRARSMSMSTHAQNQVQNTPKKKWHLLLNFLPEQKRLKQLISFQVWQVTEGLLIALKALNRQTNFFEGLKNYDIWVAFFIATTVHVNKIVSLFIWFYLTYICWNNTLRLRKFHYPDPGIHTFKVQDQAQVCKLFIFQVPLNYFSTSPHLLKKILSCKEHPVL